MSYSRLFIPKIKILCPHFVPLHLYFPSIQYERIIDRNFSFWLYHSFNNISTSSKLSKSRIASIGTLPPQSCSQSYRRLLIYDLKRTLTAKEFSVIYALIFKELSVAEIAEKQGISRQAVNQMKNSAIKKLCSR